MKTEIHPEYVEAHVRCTCGNEFTTRSTQAEIHVEICSNCHPFYTGRQKLVDTGGRVERFKRRQAAARAKQTARPTGHGRDAPGQLDAQRDAPVGGQAVLEGVMMRGVSCWAVAVRRRSVEARGARPDGAPWASRGPVVPADLGPARDRLLRLPIVRGVVALGESLAIGSKAPRHHRRQRAACPRRTRRSELTWIGTSSSPCLAVGLFFLLPVGLDA